MQVHVKRSEWDRLPFREDVATGEFQPNGRYRSRQDPGALHVFKGTPERDEWWTFGVDVDEDDLKSSRR